MWSKLWNVDEFSLGFGIEFQVSSPSLNLVSSDLEILQVSMLGLMFTIIAKESGTILGTLI